MTAKIFEYKGNVAFDIAMDGKFINDPFGPNQLGCVISTKEIEISPAAIEVIKRAKREGGSFSTLMLTKHSQPDAENPSSIAVVGGGKVHLGTDISIGRDCDLEVLNDCVIVEDMEAPDDYKAFIDGLS